MKMTKLNTDLRITEFKGDANNLKGSNLQKSTRYFFYGANVQNFPSDVGNAGIISVSNYGLYTSMEILDINKKFFCLGVWIEVPITSGTWSLK